MFSTTNTNYASWSSMQYSFKGKILDRIHSTYFLLLWICAYRVSQKNFIKHLTFEWFPSADTAMQSAPQEGTFSVRLAGYGWVFNFMQWFSWASQFLGALKFVNKFLLNTVRCQLRFFVNLKLLFEYMYDYLLFPREKLIFGL